jgi:hypothetical protein
MTPSACASSGGSYVGGGCSPNPCSAPSPLANVPPERDRQGGDTIGSATVVGSLPYADSGSTTGFANDYDEVCPYTGSTAPDLVYRYTATSNVAITIDLCASAYDTKLYVYLDVQGCLVACSDDASCGYSGYQSQVEGVSLAAGHTYYIVVDGYGSSSGSYELVIAGFEPCAVPCPSGAMVEGEGPCVDNYVDQYDGGCNGSGWFEIMAQYSGCAAVCGTSCTYLYQGLSYRDTDWYAAIASGGPVTATCTAEFPLQFIFIYGPDCDNLQYNYLQAAACSPATLCYNIASGGEFWLWVGPSVFSGIPTSNYVLDVCGLQGGIIPTEVLSWGAVKARYLAPPARPENQEIRTADPATPPAPTPAAAPVVNRSHGKQAPARFGVTPPPKPGATVSGAAPR